MIRRIQALNYRCLRHVDVTLDRFHVMVGPNASGKSTLFDAVAFLGDLVADGLDAALERRTRNFQDLVWGRPKEALGFELAVEFELPQAVKDRLPPAKDYQVFRYEVAIGEGEGGVSIASERGILMPERKIAARRRSRFPEPLADADTILMGTPRGIRTVLNKHGNGADTFNVEVAERSGPGRTASMSFGDRHSTLRNLPESFENFPASTYVKRNLRTRIKPLFLDSARMRQASPPNRHGAGLAPDGSNLPWVIERLRDDHQADYGEWLRHVRTILTDLEDIRVVVRPDDRHAYLMLSYQTGVQVPTWMTADGTLRFLALTILPYLPATDEIYLVEEPENGVHPLALDPVYDSLASAYSSQVLVATHSPVLLKMAKPEDSLCFGKDEDGATDIIKGDEHPRLKNRHAGTDMSLLFATGVRVTV